MWTLTIDLWREGGAVQLLTAPWFETEELCLQAAELYVAKLYAAIDTMQGHLATCAPSAGA